MQAQHYLFHLLKTSGIRTLSAEEKNVIKNVGLETFILQRLLSKKFRKKKLDTACIERTKQAIHINISAKKPLSVIYPQGGYKLWRFPSSPEVDWAEFFTIAYVLQYLAPITAAYKPGVHLTFYMHTLLMEVHDNLTTKEIQEYVDSFEKLLVAFRKYLPQNITISILRDADLYSREEYFKALEEGKMQAEKDFAQWPTEKKADYARMSKLNIKWKGKEDWSKLTKQEKERKLYLSALYETAAVYNLPRVFEKVKNPNNVLLFTKPTKEFIGIGSTKSSVAKYWVGFGVLEKHGNTFLERVLTPSQFAFAKKQSFQEEKVNILNQKNFKTVRVYDVPLRFDAQ